MFFHAGFHCSPSQYPHKLTCAERRAGDSGSATEGRSAGEAKEETEEEDMEAGCEDRTGGPGAELGADSLETGRNNFYTH